MGGREVAMGVVDTRGGKVVTGVIGTCGGEVVTGVVGTRGGEVLMVLFGVGEVAGKEETAIDGGLLGKFSFDDVGKVHSFRIAILAHASFAPVVTGLDALTRS